MNAKSVNERVSDMRSRRRAEGLVKLELWVHEKDVSRIKKAAAEFAFARARALEQGFVLRSIEEDEAHYAALAKRLFKGKRNKRERPVKEEP
jgi:hypothetical protein